MQKGRGRCGRTLISRSAGGDAGGTRMRAASSDLQRPEVGHREVRRLFLRILSGGGGGVTVLGILCVSAVLEMRNAE